ncbi:MAG TPA: hypothetical protein PK024_04640 [Methanospirillum sp.]|uniref:hypothetical protein n=1 Tax=Methanospirillum sp. TaxID=45200 RepID=UPI002BBC9944|nr:hypothetical protein [Methanospirillum sp.]HOJ96112.1 hypothetical protein [Methanospirillum sp.]HPP76764.1 hypothetical protein [Methanospirillum sp.]
MVDEYKLGTYTSDLTLEEKVLKASALTISELVDLETIQNMEFIDAVNQRTTNNLDVHMYFRKNKPGGAFQIGEQIHAPYTRYETFQKNLTLKEYRSGVAVDDIARVRLDEANQIMNAVQMAGEAFAEYRDMEILETLINGAGVEVDAGTKWNNVAADITGDIGNLLDKLFTQDTTNVSEREIDSIIIYYPSKLYSQIREPARFLTNAANTVASRIQVNTSDLDWSRQTYGITWMGSKKLNYVGDAIAVIRSGRTADHYTFVNDKVPQVEQARNPYHGVNEWINTRFFGTFLYPRGPDPEDINKNDRVLRIKTVCDKTAV